MLKNGTTDEWEGYCIDLMDELKKLMGFEYELYQTEDGEYGKMNEEDETQWNGMINELIQKVC